jgi:long-chain acyl-CoA synthetase
VEKVWLKSYPDFVPSEIDPDAYPSLVDIFERSNERFSNEKAYTNLNTVLTYQQVDHYTRQFAAFLQNELRMKQGDRIAIMLPNVLAYPVALFGALRAGLIVVNVNPLYTVDELVHQLNDSGAKTIVVLSNFATTVEKALPRLPGLQHVIISRMGDFLPKLKAAAIHFILKYILKKIPDWNIPNAICFEQALKKGQQYEFHRVKLKGEDIAFLQYTGGTTGISKGAILTHRNLVANLQQADAWFYSLLRAKNQTIITALPLYHIFSLTANGLFFYKIGGFNVLITDPRNTKSMIKEMSKHKFTVITGVNTLFNRLLKMREFSKLDFGSLQLTLGGGMSVQKTVAEHWEEVTHIPLLEAYGLTETSPCVTINPVNLKSYNGTVGLPVSSTDICILDLQGNELGLGQAGELAVKGPQVMKGYWQNPEETKKVFTKEGWLLTGDIASVDENGFVRILERKKDMIIVSGFNVYPNEIEDVIARIEGVLEVAVIGVKDDRSGEVVKAFIVKDDPELTEERIFEFCRNHLTAYKVPKYIDFCTDLPKTNVGKILRRALREHPSN